MFVGSCNGFFRALDAATGKVRWATQAGPGSIKYFFHGDPFITSDLVVIGADGGGAGGVTGHVHAFERATGKQRWAHPAGPGVWGAIAGLARSVYALTGSGQLVALDLESGAVRWSHPIKVRGWQGATVLDNRVVVGASDGLLQALDAATGRVDWRTDVGAPITTAVTQMPQGLYVGTQAGTVARIEPAKGATQGALKLDATLKPAGSMIRARDALLVLLTDDGENYRALVSIDPTLSATRWRLKAGDRWTTTRVFVWADTAVLGTGAGEVLGYCAGDARPAWSHKVRGTVRAVGGAGDTVYVSTTEGSLYAIQPPATCKAA